MQPGVESGDLSFGESVEAGAQGVADPVERIVLVAAVAELLLLDSAAGFLHRRQPEPDHMEGVQHGDGVGELVSDGVGVPAKGSRVATWIPVANASPRACSQPA